LIDGPYSDTNFGEAFRKANLANSKDDVVLVDFESYTPAYEAPASFIASPIFDGDEKIGVALFQMPLDRITQVMSERSALGETGEAYLVGPDYLMRSDTHLDGENHSVVGSYRNPKKGRAETKAVQGTLAGKDGVEIGKNYLGSTVISAFRPVHVGNLTWAMITEIGVDEAFKPVETMKAAAARHKASLLWWIVGLIAVGGISLIAWAVSKTIAGPIEQTVSVLEAVASGDLTRRLEVVDNAVQFRERAILISDSSQNLANGAQVQNAGVEQSSAQLDQFASSISSVSENAKQAASHKPAARLSTTRTKRWA